VIIRSWIGIGLYCLNKLLLRGLVPCNLLVTSIRVSFILLVRLDCCCILIVRGLLRGMESGSMNVKKPSKAKGLATRIGNIDGKMLTNASMPLKDILKSAGLDGKTGSFALPRDHGPVVSDPKFALQQGVRLARSKSDVPKLGVRTIERKNPKILSLPCGEIRPPSSP
jgi:hypothetical protein